MDQETPEERAKRIDAEGRCLVCGKAEENRKRGLCSADYQKWRRVVKNATAEELAQLEEELVSQGAILPDRRFSTDPFKDALFLVRERISQDDQLKEKIEIGDAVIDQAVAERSKDKLRRKKAN